jgi:hypothetical protein
MMEFGQFPGANAARANCAAAESVGVGLIPSLFWTYFTVPGLVGDSVNQWGNVNSESTAFMRTHTLEILARYKDSPAIWAWKFGNANRLDACGEVRVPNQLAVAGADHC